jgi:small subunit ribosomal protein S10
MNPPKKESEIKKKPSKKKDSKKDDIAESAVSGSSKKVKGEEKKVQSIRIRLSAFDHMVLDEAAAKILDTAERSGAVVHGPTPLPTKIRKFTVQRSTFKHKDARDQFEMRTHRRLIDLSETTFNTIESLQSLSLPSGVDIEIKMG